LKIFEVVNSCAWRIDVFKSYNWRDHKHASEFKAELCSGNGDIFNYTI
jgi:hypothetical protein